MKQTTCPKQPWYRTGLGVLAAAVVFPPAGLIWLWCYRGAGFLRKIFGTAGIAALALLYLFVFFGMRIVPDGSGIPKIITFARPEAQARALEAHRAEQRARLAVRPEEPTAGADEVPAARAPEEPAKNEPAGIPVDAYWKEYRGPLRDGRYDQTAILTRWPAEGLEPAWKQPGGGGYASFSVAGGRAFTIEQRRDREVVAAYDLPTGRELWNYGWKAFFQETMGGDGPRATPTWDDGRVYALGATGHLQCLEAESGTPVWSRNILEDQGAHNLEWGMAASPLVVGDRIIVLPGGRKDNSVVAYDKRDGKILWKALSDKQAYASPMLATLAGKRQLVVMTASRVVGLTVEEGRQLWEFPWVTTYDTNSAQPLIVDESRLVVSSGYGHGAALLEIERKGEKYVARPVWESPYLKNRFNSSVLFDGHIYGLDEGILVCISAATGERLWKGGRYGYGQVLLATGHLIITTEDGDVVLVKASPKAHEEMARFSALDGKTWNTPALADGYLLVRNESQMAAFKIAGK